MKNINFRILAFFVLLTFLPGFFSCTSEKKNRPTINSFEEAVKLETFKSTDGWGYEVKVNGKTKIKQPFIPVIEGNIPFASQTDAQRTGELILEKIKRRQSPVIYRKELDSLQIKY